MLDNDDTNMIIGSTLNAMIAPMLKSLTSFPNTNSAPLSLNPITASNTFRATSNNTNPALAKIGNLITISFTASEPIWPSVTINGYIWALTSRVSEQNWTAAYTMKSTDTSGEVKFNIRFQDLAGNIGDTATTTSDHSMVLFDKTSP